MAGMAQVSRSPAARRRAAVTFGRALAARGRARCRTIAVRSNLTGVHESLTLLRFPDSCPEEDVTDVVDKVWSLQYMAAGPVCGSAGPLLPLAPPGAAPPPPFTHAVLFRYSNRATLDRFTSNFRVKQMLGTTAAELAEGVSTLCFEGAVPSELEAIFRRGAEWDSGYELVVALEPQPGAAQEDVAEFLQLTQQLATSAAYAAVQASSGACFSLENHHPAAGDEAEALQRPEVILLARFQSLQQVNEFTACPPVAAVLGDDVRSPLRALWAAALEVAPSDSSSTSPQRGAGGATF